MGDEMDDFYLVDQGINEGEREWKQKTGSGNWLRLGAGSNQGRLPDPILG